MKLKILKYKYININKSFKRREGNMKKYFNILLKIFIRVNLGRLTSFYKKLLLSVYIKI
jgi:hypothetical protein